MRAKAIVQRRNGRVGRRVRPHPVAADAKEAVRREAEEQRLHDRYAAEWLDEHVRVRGPAAQGETMVTLTATGDCLGLTRAAAALQELEVCRLVCRLATTDIQSAAQPQAEDAGVTGETESAEKWSSGLLMSRRISFEHHRSLRRHGSRREQRHDDGGAYQEQ